jgi:hypothetical protein
MGNVSLYALGDKKDFNIIAGAVLGWINSGVIVKFYASAELKNTLEKEDNYNEQ